MSFNTKHHIATDTADVTENMGETDVPDDTVETGVTDKDDLIIINKLINLTHETNDVLDDTDVTDTRPMYVEYVTDSPISRMSIADETD